MWLFAILIGVPILEIALFIQVGGFIGLWPTLAIVILTAVAGTILLRNQGLETIGRLQSSVSEGRNPMDPIAHGALILVAGVLLLTPGFFTDFIGFSFLIPPFRKFLITRGAEKFASGSFVYVNGQRVTEPRPPQDDVVDGEYEIVPDDEDTTPSSSGWTKNAP